MFVADGGKSVRALLEPTGEPFRPEMRPYEVATELGVYDMWKLQLERSELQREYLEQWSSYGDLDAILSENWAPTRQLLSSNRFRSYHAIYNCGKWQIQICRIYRRFQRRRLFGGHLPLQCHCR